MARPTEGAYARGARIAEHASLDDGGPDAGAVHIDDLEFDRAIGQKKVIAGSDAASQTCDQVAGRSNSAMWTVPDGFAIVMAASMGPIWGKKYWTALAIVVIC